jgi:hypothetical protein
MVLCLGADGKITEMIDSLGSKQKKDAPFGAFLFYVGGPY